jgi:hypothetical protein
MNDNDSHMTEKLNNINEILNSLQKNLKAPKDKRNNFGNFQYRNAEGILEAYKEEVKKETYPNDLVLTHSFKIDLIGSRIFAICTSTLETSCAKKEAVGFAEIDVSKKGMDQSQLSGAVTSYAKKYALCNLFAIDDSKDDPDADEKPEKVKKEPTKNAFGLSKDGDLASGADMTETLENENKELVKRLTARINQMGSAAELQGWLEEKAVKTAYAKLDKYFLEGFAKVKKTELSKFQELDPND